MNAGSALVAPLSLTGPRRLDRLRQAHPEVDLVEQRLQHGRDDRRAAGRADRLHDLAVARHDRRATSSCAAACSAATEFAVPVGKLKSVSSLLSRKPRCGEQDARAGDLLDRVRVADDVAPAVGDHEVVRVLLVVCRCRSGTRCTVPPPLNGVGSPGATGVGSAVSGRSARRAAWRRPARAGRLTGTSTKSGVADVLAAVGEGQLRRLDVAEQRARRGRRDWSKFCEDVHRLADGRAAAGGRAACRTAW